MTHNTDTAATTIYTVTLGDGGNDEECSSLEEAKEAMEGFARDCGEGWWEVQVTVPDCTEDCGGCYEDCDGYDGCECSVECECDDDVVASEVYYFEPAAPACDDGEEHDFAGRDASGLGSVRGSGGGVVSMEVCVHCGTARRTDTWATCPLNGQQGHGYDVVTYEERHTPREECEVAALRVAIARRSEREGTEDEDEGQAMSAAFAAAPEAAIEALVGEGVLAVREYDARYDDDLLPAWDWREDEDEDEEHAWAGTMTIRQSLALLAAGGMSPEEGTLRVVRCNG